MDARKPRILVVDDDHECRLLLSTIVARAGLEVDAVADGDMALAMMRNRQPDLVLLDAHLPRRDGFEVCRAIKENPETGRVQVLMLTAFSTEDARARSLAAGADEFVEKPFRNDALLEIVRHLLAIREAARQLDPGERAVVAGLTGARLRTAVRGE